VKDDMKKLSIDEAFDANELLDSSGLCIDRHSDSAVGV
jgi:hypothetical protein